MLNDVEHKLDALARRNKRKKTLVSRFGLIWMMIVRLITLACIIMGAIVSSQVLPSSSITALGLALAIGNSITGTGNEIVSKLNTRLASLQGVSVTVMMAKVKLMKTLDQAMDDNYIDTKEFQNIVDCLSSAIKSVQGHHKVHADGANHATLT